MAIILTDTFSRNAGYYVNDNTASGGQRVEGDIQTCKHCQKVLYKHLWVKNGGFCRGCNSPVCSHCATKMMKEGCKPYIALLEQSLENDAKIQQFRRLAGLEDPTHTFSVSTGPDRR